MKEFFEERPERRFLLLVVAVLLISGMVIYQSLHQLRLQDQLTVTASRIAKAKQDEAALLEQRESTEQQVALLAQYEKRIPMADSGYVWVSRALRGAVPKLTLKISPPQFDEQQLQLPPDYCCGTFDIRGTSSLEELLHILQKAESELPFARVQDLQFSFEPDGVNFSFSLMAVMRLDADLES